MKKLITALCLAGCLALAFPASAAVRTFGPDFPKFTIDVPDGWTVTPRDDGCQLESPDRKSSFTVQTMKSGGKSAAEMAMAVEQGLLKQNPGNKVLAAKEISPNKTVMECEFDKVKMTVVVVVEGDKCCVVAAAGSDADGIASILKTVKYVQ